jgi:apolipoprotein N-acyltransferase
MPSLNPPHFLVSTAIDRQTIRAQELRVRRFLVTAAQFVAPCLTALTLWGTIQLPSLFWLSFLAMIPFAALLLCRPSVAGCVGSYLGGLLYFLVGTDWIRTIDQGMYWYGPRVGDWLLQACLLALSWPAMYLVGCVIHRRTRLCMSVALPMIWICYEFLLRHMWTIIDGNGWYMTKIAYALVNRLTLIQIADVGGLYAVAAVIAVVNGALVDCIILRRKALISVALASSLLATSALYGVWRLSQSPDGRGPVVWLMPPEPRRIWESAFDPKQPGTLLVWSENVLDEPILDKAPDFDEKWLECAPPGAIEHCDDDPAYVRGELLRYAQALRATLVVGAPRIAFRNNGVFTYNSAVCIDAELGYQGCYDKVWLVPWVETTPYHRIALDGGQSLELTPGDCYPIFGTSHGQRFAIAICYDAMFPELFRRYLKDKPDFFVICSSEMTDKTLRVQRETFVCGQFRAIETRRAVVRNVRNGYSGMFDGNGRVIARAEGMDLDQPCSLGRVPIDDRFSFYSWSGDWLPITASLSCLLLLIPRSLVARCPLLMASLQIEQGGG